MMTIRGISKHYGAKQVLKDVSFTARDGAVTGFLGPNGAGKSTTMKAMLGLISTETGDVLIDGSHYRDLASPLATVGAVLDARSAHKGRSAIAHLKAVAYTNNIPMSRVDEVIQLTGLSSVKDKKAGGFSLGMSQRLAIATALLGDPHNLVLDEPINGLDPEGVKWVRDLCRQFSSEGKAVLLSSHLMSEVALTADDLVIIGEGRIIENTTVSDFVRKHSRNSMQVVTSEPEKLMQIFANAPTVQVQETVCEDGYPADARAFTVTGADLKTAAEVFAQAQLVLYRLNQERASLEQAYMDLTHNYSEYRAQLPPMHAQWQSSPFTGNFNSQSTSIPSPYAGANGTYTQNGGAQ